MFSRLAIWTIPSPNCLLNEHLYCHDTLMQWMKLYRVTPKKQSLCSITWSTLIYCLTELTVRPPLCLFGWNGWLTGLNVSPWTLNKRSRFLVRQLSPSSVLWWSHLAELKVKEILIQGGIFKHISMQCISLCTKISDIWRWSAQSVATILWRRRPSSAVTVERDLHPYKVSRLVIE